MAQEVTSTLEHSNRKEVDWYLNCVGIYFLERVNADEIIAGNGSNNFRYHDMPLPFLTSEKNETWLFHGLLLIPQITREVTGEYEIWISAILRWYGECGIKFGNPVCYL